ncbi:hypothetical protein BB561_003297 [Smittium simulii]|uniref:SCP domain-containing protein n=1 Tax=Smittium simulii TaxID=133385 RepID=A0A2T9YM26_9FUNG|nr:hypothetical protein BB561_003297 [Smittium simulii]
MVSLKFFLTSSNFHFLTVAGLIDNMMPGMPMNSMSGMPMNGMSGMPLNGMSGMPMNGNMIKSPIWNNQNYDPTKFNQFLQNCYNMPRQNSNQSNDTNQNQPNNTNQNQSNDTNQNQSNDTNQNQPSKTPDNNSESKTDNASDTDLAKAKELLSIVNGIRSKNSKTPLVLESSLVKAALAHSKYMAGIKQMTHNNSKFSRMITRIIADDRNLGNRGCAENIAVVNDGVKGVMGSWEGSPVHFQNIIENRIRMGIAKYQGYWTQIFT